MSPITGRLPLAFASMHAALTILVFAIAIICPIRSGLLPIIMFGLDFPVSILIIKVHDLIGFDWGVRGVLLIDALLFLSIGTAWFYLIGLAVSKVAVKLGF
jgi:hypothetical protein